MAILFRPFGFLAPKDFLFFGLSNILDFKRTWWRLFQKRVVCTNLDIYIFITVYRNVLFDVNIAIIRK